MAKTIHSGYYLAASGSTATLHSAAGRLLAFLISHAQATVQTVTFYDNTASSGTVTPCPIPRKDAATPWAVLASRSSRSRCCQISPRWARPANIGLSTHSSMKAARPPASTRSAAASSVSLRAARAPRPPRPGDTLTSTAWGTGRRWIARRTTRPPIE